MCKRKVKKRIWILFDYFIVWATLTPNAQLLRWSVAHRPLGGLYRLVATNLRVHLNTNRQTQIPSSLHCSCAKNSPQYLYPPGQ